MQSLKLFSTGRMVVQRFGVLAFAVLVLASILGLTQPATAQVETASIHGTVTDPAGAVLPNATVTILNTSTGTSSTVKTNGSGYFQSTQLQTGGPYNVEITAPGFQKFQANGITLNLNDNRTVDGKLQVGSPDQTVQVQAVTVQVETTETQLKADISGQQIAQLPLLGRDASQLEKTAPGVVESSDRFGSFSANGAQTQSNSYLLDGADNNDTPLQSIGLAVNPDALAEEAIVTSTMNPEYARNSGAIINQSLKTGTNSFHGSAFEFYRDTFLNNGNYFSKTRPPFHQNLYGGTLGGPVLKNKLFFFAAYQGFRNSTGVTQQTSVFSPAQLQGNFSQDQAFLGNGGLSGNPMPFSIAGCPAGTPWNQCNAIAGGTLPTSAFNSLALNLTQKYVPSANVVVPSTVAGGATSYLYNFNTSDSAKQDQGVIRVDYHPSQKDTLWASSIFESSPDSSTLSFGGGTLPGFGQVDAEHFKIFNADYTHTFNSSTINELRAGYFRFNFAAVSPAQIIAPSSVGFNITPQNSEQSLPYIGLTGYFALGGSWEGPQPRKDTNLLASDIFTKIAGNHTLKVGGTYEQFLVSNPYFSNNNGYFSFAGSGTYSSGDSAIDFLTGIPTSYTQTSGSIIQALSKEYYAFVQDSWKVSHDFTLNYGISWDTETPWANHQWAGEGITCWQNSSATSSVYPNGAPGLLYPGDPGCTTYGAASPKYNHFGPRFGFAWSPSSGPSLLVGDSGSHNFAIRGGVGLYYNRDSEEEALQNLSSPPFFFASHGAGDFGGNPSFANPFVDVAGNGSEANPFPYILPKPGSQLDWQGSYYELDMSNVDKKYFVPYAYNFNLNVQRQLPGSMVLQVGYVGSIGRKLARVTEDDPVTPAGHAACLADTTGCAANGANIHLLYPQYTAQPATTAGGYPWYLSVGDQLSNGASSYHSLQVSLEKQVTHGLYFHLAYTWSHALDNGSGYESSSGTSAQTSVGANGRVVIFAPGYDYLNYGNSDYDARQRFTALYVYQIPILSSMRDNRIMNEALGGWHISGLTALQSGFPVTINQTGTYSNLWCDGWTYYGCTDVPNTSSFNISRLNPRASSHLAFNTSSFAPETVGTFGNVGRNFFAGPGFNYTNLSLFKDFSINREGSKYIELRLESFNVFNHANFGQPDGDFSDSTFGQVLGVTQPAFYGGQSTDPQPGRATQLGAKFVF